MRGDQKKEALRAYKDLKPALGVYAVKCLASGQNWVGQSRNLDKQQNRIWAELRLGGHRTKSLQAAWTVHGESRFQYERLAELSDEEAAFPEARLKELRDAWRERLDAELL